MRSPHIHDIASDAEIHSTIFAIQTQWLPWVIEWNLGYDNMEIGVYEHLNVCVADLMNPSDDIATLHDWQRALVQDWFYWVIWHRQGDSIEPDVKEIWLAAQDALIRRVIQHIAIL